MPVNLRDRWVFLPSSVRFVIVFLLSLTALSVVYPWLSVVFNDQAVRFMGATASLVGHGLTALGQPVEVIGRFVRAPHISVEVIEECTGAYETLIFWAAVLAYPTRWRAKLWGAAGGMVLILAMNILRIMFLIIVGGHWPQAFDFMHVYFWQATLILMIVSVWLAWIKLIASRANAAEVDLVPR